MENGETNNIQLGFKLDHVPIYKDKVVETNED